jgi:hypothetical protein
VELIYSDDGGFGNALMNNCNESSKIRDLQLLSTVLFLSNLAVIIRFCNECGSNKKLTSRVRVKKLRFQ